MLNAYAALITSPVGMVVFSTADKLLELVKSWGLVIGIIMVIASGVILMVKRNAITFITTAVFLVIGLIFIIMPQFVVGTAENLGNTVGPNGIEF